MGKEQSETTTVPGGELGLPLQPDNILCDAALAAGSDEDPRLCRPPQQIGTSCAARRPRLRRRWPVNVRPGALAHVLGLVFPELALSLTFSALSECLVHELANKSVHYKLCTASLSPGPSCPPSLLHIPGRDTAYNPNICEDEHFPAPKTTEQLRGSPLRRR